MKPHPPSCRDRRVGEFQCKALVCEIVRLRRAGCPPLSARLLAIIQTLTNCQEALGEAICRIPEGEADGVLEATAMRQIVAAIDETWLVAQRYMMEEAKQARPRRKLSPANVANSKTVT